MRALKIIGLLFIPIVLLLGAGIVYWLTMDTAVLRAQLTKYASQQLKRELIIAGDLQPGFSLAGGFSVNLSQVTLGNVAGWQPKNMLTLDRLELVVDPFAFLQDRIAVKRVYVKGADAYFEQRGSRNNWQFVDEAAEDKTVTPPAGSDAPAMKIAIDDLKAEDVKLTHIADGARKVYEIKSLALAVGSDSPLKADLDAVADGQKVKLKINAGSLDAINNGAKQDVDAQLEYGPHKVDVKGTYRRNGDTHALSDARLSANGISASGDISANMAGSKPDVTLNLVIPELDLAAFKGDEGSAGGSGGGAAAAGADGPLFSRDPLPWDMLDAANADVALDIKKLRNADTNLGPANIQAKLRGGSLNGTVIAQPPGAKEPINLKLAASSSKSVSVNLSAPSLDPSLLMGDDPIVQAPAAFNLAIAGRGSSLHDVASTADGSATLKFQPGTLNVQGMPPILAGTLGSLVGTSQLDGARLACATVDFGIANGVASTRGMGFDSAVVIGAGEGSVDLGAETVSLRFVAEPVVAAAKGARFPVYVKGALKQPVTTVDTAAITGQVAQAAAGRAVKLIGNEKVAGIVEQLRGATRQEVAGYIAMPKNPCRPNDVDKPPVQQQPAAATTPQPTIQQQIQQQLPAKTQQKIDDIQKKLGGFGLQIPGLTPQQQPVQQQPAAPAPAPEPAPAAVPVAPAPTAEPQAAAPAQ